MKRLFLILITIILVTSMCSCSTSVEGQYSDDYALLWNKLESSYPYFNYLRDSMKIDLDDIRARYSEKVRSIESAEDFASILNSIFSELHNFGHLYLVDPEVYKTYYNAYIYDEDYTFNREPFVDILEASDLSEIYVKPESKEEQESETAAQAPEIWVQYFDDCDALYLRINSFQHELIERDGVSIKKALDDHPGIKNLIIDITNNYGGSDWYWEQNLVATLGGRYKFSYRSYYKKTDLTDEYYGSLESTGIPEAAPEWIDELGLDRCFNNNVIVPSEDINVGEAADIKKWVLTSERTYSSSDKFVNFCKQTGWATVVGTKTGGDGLASTPLLLKLPDSGLLVRFSALAGENSDGSMNVAGTAPDEVCIKGEDPMDRCLELIREDEAHY